MPERPDLLARRGFFSRAARRGAALLAPAVVPAEVLGRGGAAAPSEKIAIAGIGIGGRGEQVLKVLLGNGDVRFAAVCDVRAERRLYVKDLVDARSGDRDCSMHRDLREVLGRPDIDAVLIATGDRWHTPAAILAAKAGKDIYCEKPCCMTIAESLALADVFRRTGRIFQAGTQRRNVPNFAFAVRLARSGMLGKLRAVHANTGDPATTHAWLPGEPEPPRDEVDWDLWLGPCPRRPYNSQYVRGGWRGFFDFHGGGLLEWGAHTVDLCQWANGADGSAPVEYEPRGNDVVAAYANGVRLVMREKGWLGLGTCSVRFEGDEGWVEAGDTGQVRVHPESLISAQTVPIEAGTDPRAHVREFLDCVRTRARPAADAGVTCGTHIACHAALIAWQLGRRLSFDPVRNEFLGDDAANRMRSRAMREPWRV
jgi:predicted dehydrogenase